MVDIDENDVLHLYKEKYQVTRVIGEISDDSEDSEERENSIDQSYEKIND